LYVLAKRSVDPSGCEHATPYADMPRAPPCSVSVQAAHTFVSVFLTNSPTDDSIVPKNGELKRGADPLAGSVVMRMGG
jgi:hypothetical protein